MPPWAPSPEPGVAPDARVPAGAGVGSGLRSPPGDGGRASAGDSAPRAPEWMGRGGAGFGVGAAGAPAGQPGPGPSGDGRGARWPHRAPTGCQTLPRAVGARYPSPSPPSIPGGAGGLSPRARVPRGGASAQKWFPLSPGVPRPAAAGARACLAPALSLSEPTVASLSPGAGARQISSFFFLSRPWIHGVGREERSWTSYWHRTRPLSPPPPCRRGQPRLHPSRAARAGVGGSLWSCNILQLERISRVL